MSKKKENPHLSTMRDSRKGYAFNESQMDLQERGSVILEDEVDPSPQILGHQSQIG
jgi:hypothetical protein